MSKKETTKVTKTTKPVKTTEPKEIRWSDKKIGLLKLLKKLNVTSSNNGITLGELREKVKDGDDVLINIDPSFDMTVEGYLEWSSPREGERSNRFFVTKKGLQKLTQLTK